MMILISGPYRGGTDDDAVLMLRNLERLGSVALPLLKLAGSKTIGDAAYQEIAYPIAHRLIERCDAILRLPGESKGADADVHRANTRCIPVYRALNEIPGIEAIAESHA